jgi:hypothetical protein
MHLLSLNNVNLICQGHEVDISGTVFLHITKLKELKLSMSLTKYFMNISKATSHVDPVFGLWLYFRRFGDPHCLHLQGGVADTSMIQPTSEP